MPAEECRLVLDATLWRCDGRDKTRRHPACRSKRREPRKFDKCRRSESEVIMAQKNKPIKEGTAFAYIRPSARRRRRHIVLLWRDNHSAAAFRRPINGFCASAAYAVLSTVISRVLP